MKMKLRVLFVAMVVAVVLSGCAATDMRMKGNFNQVSLDVPKKHRDDYADKDVEKVVLGDLLIEPFDSTGIKETPALLRGEFSCFDAPYPDELKNEEYIPERIKWYALVVSEGYEYLGQLIKKASGDTELLVDGTAKALKNAKALILSTRAEKVFKFETNDKGIKVSRDKLMGNADYREDLVLKYGTSLSNFSPSKKLIAEIGEWNRYDSPRGYILTPLSEDKFREIVSINPGYTYSQRLVKQGWILSTNPVGMIIHNGIINNINAVREPAAINWENNKEGEDED